MSGWIPDFSLPESAKTEIAGILYPAAVEKVERACAQALALAEEHAGRTGSTGVKTRLKKIHEKAAELAELLDDQAVQEELRLLSQTTKYPFKRGEVVGSDGFFKGVDVGRLGNELHFIINVTSGHANFSQKGNNNHFANRFLKFRLYEICGAPKRNIDSLTSKSNDRMSKIFRVLRPILGDSVYLPENAGNIIVEVEKTLNSLK